MSIYKPSQIASILLEMLSNGVTGISSVQSLSCVWLCHPKVCSMPGLPVHHQLLGFTQTHVCWVSDASNHLILCHPLLLPPSIFPSMRVFSNLSILRIRWPKYWSFSFNISPSNEYSGLISFRMNWLDLLAFQRTLKSLLQHHSSKASILWHSAFFTVQLSHPHLTFTGIKQSKLAWQGRLYFCRRVCYRQRSGSSIFIPEKQVPCPGSSQIEDHQVTIFPGCCLSLYWMIDNYFPHPFSSLCMSRIKPRNVAHQNVLMRKENEEVKRTKDWQLATILEFLFASQLYTFLFNYSKNESLLYFL